MPDNATVDWLLAASEPWVVYNTLRDLAGAGADSAAGRWTADGVNKPYSEFDFGQKKQASPWITFLALRTLARGET